MVTHSKALLAALIALCFMALISQSTAGTVKTLPPVQVKSFGPPVWVVKYGSDTMYIIGSITPIPTKMIWSRRDIRLLLSGANVLILPFRLEIYERVSLVKEAKLDWLEHYRWPYNAKGSSLKTRLDARTYSLWRRTWQKYGNSTSPPDQLRPYYAFKRLFRSYEHRHNLSAHYLLHLLRSIAEHYSLDIKSPVYVWHVHHAQATWLTMTEMSPRCFYNSLKTMNSDYHLLDRRAKAWSVGDMPMLEKLGFGSNIPACPRDDEYFLSHGFPDIPKLSGKWWAQYVFSAMRRHRTIVAVEPVWSLENGVLTNLEALGARITAPRLQAARALKANLISKSLSHRSPHFKKAQ